MTGVALFFVVGFWVFVLCLFCVAVAALRDEKNGLGTLFNGVAGCFFVAAGAGFCAAVLWVVWKLHLYLLGA